MTVFVLPQQCDRPLPNKWLHWNGLIGSFISSILDDDDDNDDGSASRTLFDMFRLGLCEMVLEGPFFSSLPVFCAIADAGRDFCWFQLNSNVGVKCTLSTPENFLMELLMCHSIINSSVHFMLNYTVVWAM